MSLADAENDAIEFDLETFKGVSSWLRAEVAARLGREVDDIRDDELFSALGMDSMRATSLMAALSQLTGKRWSPALLWAYPTIRALAARVVACDDVTEEPEVAARCAAQTDRRSDDPVAVVGMACRFPGANDLESFWRLLEAGADAVETAPDDRWSALVAGNFAAAGDMVTAEAGFLNGRVDEFDPLFFGISPREAQEMDPQQRLFLEVAWEALEDAGIPEGGLAGSGTGVFAGAIWHDYADLACGDPGRLSSHSATGRALNMVANRLSYVLGLRGPSVVLDSACSSSLLAVHMACQSIWSGESSTAIAGGVNLLLSPETMVSLSKFGGLSPDGRCKAFDARADGFGRGEGCGVIVLKPLSRALADGDSIWCTIRGSAANNDGLSNGLTAPNPVAQEEVLRAAYRRAGVLPAEVHYVETHGTGTALGDPIEAMALGSVLGKGRPEDRPLRIGSVKTNVGHLEAAAGIAGFIKTALALKHRRIPQNLHFETPNPHIPFDEQRLRVPTAAEPWPEDSPLYAGVSAFGWGGTNVHVVVEGRREPAPLCLPAGSARGVPGRPRVAFVCSPYGQQWVGMARNLFRTEPVFRSVLEECDRELARYTGWSLIQELFLDEPQARIDDVGVMQPIIFAIQVGLAAWFEAAGSRPGAVVGHSLGEIAACVIAGILDLPDAVRLVHHYSDKQRRVAGPDGGMAVVELSAAELEARLAGRASSVCVATRNGPRTTALAGKRAELEAIVADLRAEGVLCAMIRVDLPAHSPAIDPIMANLERALADIIPRPGRIPVISSVTGQPLDWRAVGPAYFVRNLREQVRLADATAHLLAEKFDVLLEISANPVLAPALQQSVDDFGHTATVLTSMRRDEDDRTGLVETLAALARLGAEVRLPGERTKRDSELFTLSAKTPEALRELTGRVAARLCESGPDQAGRTGGLPALAQAALRRAHQPYRLALPARTEAELAETLAAHARGESPAGLYVSGRAVENPPRVAFVFPGQGSQWIGMGRELLRREPVFHAAIRECDAAARAFVDWSIEAELLAGEEDSMLDRIDVVQPVLFAMQVALAALWRSWGIEPDAVVGHSMGEIAAAHVAGALSLEDAVQIICLRSRLLRRTSGQGAMLAVELTMEEARKALAGWENVVSIAVNNSPRSTVLSGDRDVLGEITVRLEREKVFCRWVKVDVASHSPQMDPLRPDLLAALEGLTPRGGTVPIYSTVTGAVVDGERMTATYWVDNLREPVLFGDQIARLVREGVRSFVEISPHPILLPAVEQVAAECGVEATVLPSLRRNEDERDTLLASLGRLHVLGAAARIDRALTPARYGRKLPHYPWQRERFWHEDADGTPHGTGAPGLPPRRGLLGERIDSAVQPGTHYWQMDFGIGTAATGDHRLAGAAVVPGAGFVEMALAAARQVLPGDRHLVSDVVFQQPVIVPERGLARVQVVLEGSREQQARIRFFTPEENGPVCVAQARLSAWAPSRTPGPVETARIAERMSEALDGPRYYHALAACGLGYGPAFQGIRQIARTDGEALARVSLEAEALPRDVGYLVHPSLLDSALQSAVAPLLGDDWKAANGFLSEGMGQVTVHGTVEGEMWAHAMCRAVDAGQWEADVRVYALGGALLLEVNGLRIVRLEAVPQLARPQLGAEGGEQTDPAAGAGGDPGIGALRDAIARLPTGPERRTALESAVRENVARVVKLPARRVDLDRPLRSLGVDSLMALELRNRLEGTFGIRLSATLVWNYPTIRDIALFLAGELGIPLDEESVREAQESVVVNARGGPASGEVSEGPGSPEELLERELAELNERMEAI